MDLTEQEQNTQAFEGAVSSYAIVGLRADEKTVIDRFFPQPPARILIVGCGAGRTVIPLAQRGYQVTGVDISPGMIQAAERQTAEFGVSAELCVGDAAELESQFARHSFDAIWLPFHAICFIAPIERRSMFFQAAKQLLKSDGILVFSTYNRLFPRIFTQFLKKHDGPYASLSSKEGTLWGYTALPWKEARNLHKDYRWTRLFPRYAMIPAGKNVKWKERIMRILSPLMDKSLIVIAQGPRGD